MSARMRFFAFLLLVPLSVAVLAAVRPSSGEDVADLILSNGTFYPVVPADGVQGSLAVRGGRIVYLGPDEAAVGLVGPATKVVDLEGRVVVPGFIDAHSHLLDLGKSLVKVGLVGTNSYEEVVERVVKGAVAIPPGEWIEGRGWDQSDWPVQEFPHHAPLSQAVPDHPVWLVRIDGHAALANALAMELLEIDRRTPDPPGGRLLRDAEGNPTGVLIDRAMDLASARIPPPSQEERRRRLRLAAEHSVARGLTTVTDMGVDQEAYEAYRALVEAGELPLRVSLFLEDDRELLADWFRRGPQLLGDLRLTVRGVKMYLDGALGSRGAALLQPYSDDPGNRGLLRPSVERLDDVARAASAHGFQLAVHTIGDRAAMITLDALEEVFGGPRPELRFRLEHAQVMRLEDIRRMARLGIIAAMQPTHATSDMPWAPSRLGSERLAGAYAWRKVLEAGGVLALGSDAPVEAIDPRLGLYAAVTRQDLQGNPPGGWLPEERLSRAEALRGFTLDAAYSLLLEHEVGSLEVGKRADLAVFGEDLMRIPAGQIPAAELDLTLVDGRIVYRRSEEP